MRALAGFLLLYCSASASQNTTEQAAALYQRTDYNGSASVAFKGPHTGRSAYNLIGKNYFMLGDFKKAAESFEKAVALNPLNSDNMLWLGRAYGRRADKGSKILAGRYASKARQYFEKAVALDPHNHEALNDLFDYYLNAPGFFGGGVDPAEAPRGHRRQKGPPSMSMKKPPTGGKKERLFGGRGPPSAGDGTGAPGGRPADRSRALSLQTGPRGSERCGLRASREAGAEQSSHCLRLGQILYRKRAQSRPGAEAFAAVSQLRDHAGRSVETGC